MDSNSKTPAEVMMPWVGLYVAIASFICVIAMAADAVQAVWQWKLWFPNRFFTLNAATITLIAIAMKLPVNLSTDLSDKKMVSMFFLVTMLANFLPSLGLMDDKELLMNIVALAILLITIVVNMGIQIYLSSYWVAYLIYILPLLILWPFSVALTVPSMRKKLEHRYNESQQLVSIHQEKMFSAEELKLYVKKYWMMTETRNLQFVIACSPVSSAFGVICVLFALNSSYDLTYVINFKEYDYQYEGSDYKWSLMIIHIVQLVGVVVGSIAPILRCFTSIGHYSLSKKLSKNHLNVFRVEKHWIERLQQWKRNHVHSHIPGRYLKIVFHYVKNAFLNFCLALHIVVLVICKTIVLVPRAFLILLSCCWYLFKSVLEWLKKVATTSNGNMSSEIEEYARYVIHIEEEAKLSKRILRNTLRSITELLNAEKEPRNLLMLLEKSKGFIGVVEFDNDLVQPLYPEETHNCWSLVVVTLTTIAIALPNIANGHFKGLLAGMSEGLKIVRHIEDCLDADGELVSAIKSARRVWKEVEVYRKWLKIDLQNKAHEDKTSKEILKWLGDEGEKIMKRFMSNKKSSIDRSPYKFVLASSMYRISTSILLHLNAQEISLNDEDLFEWISTIIADILFACFTNLPRVIKMKCHHNEIEKRGDNIRIAAQLLGKSKEILKILEARTLPNIDQDSMAYIDKWRVLPKIQLTNGGASTNEIYQDHHVVELLAGV
ncbi:hypothetical protein HanXRQr2_Chr11g0517551 [Helianthus annuus]|uniref:Transmembrane protein n=1 Tax=Helianthus annuus TaxID=4232 RepID=A0A251T957_HELAN|nr:uncharacterized protein LOC110888023 [Helianthus annuus]XP_021992153.1 uncharacterized protein LOC110888969 [Helianthus annuus]KAF5784269.1 hypothetical protein HanXRQr2_Chr11g0517541 [Helianthus annuus]KAF5784270.1 hypothetical protein HanXRQr2_Chr11g0517551 [Helianthus annuus]KAJ0503472.1 hypothetical protein HanHA300_Chr11g0424611 [Helianthus annuus]KAJ0503473.1 hypothetical protein HanHA300_Chr11g0424621 [Helianthus annuus]KAJ0519427.1 hypothetical protein HanHA89_Chr11g0448641 [Helian